MGKKLTKRDIDSFAYKGGWDVRWDGTIPGFGIRVYPSGKKAYVLSYRHKNRKHLLTIGQTNKITLDKARDKALQSLGTLADKIDPLEDRRRNSAGRTVEKAFEVFLERHAKSKNRSWAETKRIFDKDIKAALGNKLVQEVTRDEISKLLDSIVDRGAGIMANRTLAVLRKFFSWCIERGYIEISPVHKISKPCQEITRDRVLTNQEIQEIWDACKIEGYPFGTLVQFLLVTGQRRDEASTLRWTDINEKENIWSLPPENTKSNRRHQVPLSSMANSILVEADKLGDYVFTTKGDTPFSGFSKAKDRIDKIINSKRKDKGINKEIPAWRLHDLRRTAASGMASLGTAPHVIERVLNHSSGIISGVAAVYNRYDYQDEIQTALEGWGEKISVIISQ